MYVHGSKALQDKTLTRGGIGLSFENSFVWNEQPSMHAFLYFHCISFWSLEPPTAELGLEV